MGVKWWAEPEPVVVSCTLVHLTHHPQNKTPQMEYGRTKLHEKNVCLKFSLHSDTSKHIQFTCVVHCF